MQQNIKIVQDGYTRELFPAYAEAVELVSKYARTKEGEEESPDYARVEAAILVELMAHARGVNVSW